MVEYPLMKAALLAIVLALAMAVAGCGGDDGGDGSATGTQAESPGAKVFAEAGCGSCHTLDAAGSTGKTGPNLDDAPPSAAEVEKQVREGGGGMPSFEGDLSDQEIKDVAEFVSSSAGG
jgi:mono/diheme cytochrome c family protein